MLQAERIRPSTVKQQGASRISLGRWIIFALSLVYLGTGVFMPTAWYDNLPVQVPSGLGAIKGVTLFQACLICQGLALLAVALTGWTYKRLSQVEAIALPSPVQKQRSSFDCSFPVTIGCLVLVTVLAAALRIYQVNSGLWLDEISPLEFYRHTSVFHLLTVYYSTNSHLLNTILVKFTASIWGEQAWAVRAPAVAFGIATIPLAYALARQAFSRKSSLAVALLIAVSYHHIFFSQNARGYSEYMFFSVAASIFLVRALNQDRKLDWTLYVLAMVADVSSLIASVCVAIAHLLIVLTAVLVQARNHRPWAPLARRVAAMMSLTAVVGFQVYSVIFPQALTVLHSTYKEASSGFSALSPEFFQEVIRGLSAGFGPIVAVALGPAALVALFGLYSLLKRNWVMTLCLVLPEVVLGTFLMLKHYTVEPRFFLLALPLAMLAAVASLEDFGVLLSGIFRWPARAADSVTALGVLGIVAVSAAMLPRYYQIPKQDYRCAIAYADSLRKPNDVIVPLYLAKTGFDFYGPQLDLKEGKDFFNVRTADQWSHALQGRTRHNVIMVTTFKRALHIDLPYLEHKLEEGWTPVKTFPGTIGDGDITVWTAKND